MRNVAQLLVQLFGKDEETTRDLTAAEEQMRGITFDMFKEKVSCKVMRGIKLVDFEKLIERIARRLQMPDDIKEGVLDGFLSVDNNEIIKEFYFSKGESGNFAYGRIATIKQDGDVIDLAYSAYQMLFKLSPRMIEHRRTRRFLGITTGKKVWKETSERNLSQREKDCMSTYFMNKAIAGFRKECAGFIEN